MASKLRNNGLRFMVAPRSERFRAWRLGRADARKGVPRPEALDGTVGTPHALTWKYVAGIARLDQDFRRTLAGCYADLTAALPATPDPVGGLGPARRAASAARANASAAERRQREAIDRVLTAAEETRAQILEVAAVANTLVAIYASAIHRHHPQAAKLTAWSPKAVTGPDWLSIPGPHLLALITNGGVAALDHLSLHDNLILDKEYS